MRTLQKNYTITQPLEKVYTHWVSEDTVIPPVSKMQVQAHVGGVYKLIMPDGMSMTGIFSKVEPMRAIHFSWQWDGDDELTEVEVTFCEFSQGTGVSITHSGFKSDESLAMHSSGWDSYLKGFTEHLQNVA